MGAKQALVRLSWPAVNQAGLDYHIGTRTLLHQLQLLLPRKPAIGCKKGGKCRKAPRLCLKSLSCGNKNYKVHVAIDMSIVHCTCVLRFLWHWCLYISFCNFQRGSFAWSFLQPRNILSCVKLKRKYHKI